MDKEKQGKIIKGVGGKYAVLCEGKRYNCFVQKKVKYFYDDVMVGDNVQFVRQSKEFVVTAILPRTNNLKRPSVANVDGVLLVVAVKPEPDLLLMDKLIVNCNRQNVPIMMVLNKSDISDEAFAKEIRLQYQSEVKTFVEVSCVSGKGIEELQRLLVNKTFCLCGQSAVGKTSLLNALSPSLALPVGELSEKTQRGKHTTRHNQIYPLDNGAFVVDTAGFSMFDLPEEVKSEQLCLYFDEFFQLSKDCRFNMCTHTAEPDCAVKIQAQNNPVLAKKYQRYLELFKEIKEKEEHKFD